MSLQNCLYGNVLIYCDIFSTSASNNTEVILFNPVGIYLGVVISFWYFIIMRIKPLSLDLSYFISSQMTRTY